MMFFINSQISGTRAIANMTNESLQSEEGSGFLLQTSEWICQYT